MKLSKKETTFINSLGVARLATVNSKRMPHSVPVCPVLSGGKVYVASEKDAAKIKNIRGNRQASIVFDVYNDSWKNLRGVMLQCRASIADKNTFERARRKLYAKYPHYESDAAIEASDSVIIELAPEKKFSWGL